MLQFAQVMTALSRNLFRLSWGTIPRLLAARAFCRDNDRHENAAGRKAGRKMGAITAQQQCCGEAKVVQLVSFSETVY